MRPRDWAAQAPIIIVGFADPTKSGNKEAKQYYLLDMGISMEHLMLVAAEQGLGTCWIGGGFDETIVKEALGVPEEIRVVALTPLGYPDKVTEPRPRELDKILSRNHWESLDSSSLPALTGDFQQFLGHEPSRNTRCLSLCFSSRLPNSVEDET